MRKPPAPTMAPHRKPVWAIVAFALGVVLLVAAVVGLARGDGGSPARVLERRPSADREQLRGPIPSVGSPSSTTTTTTTRPLDPNLTPVSISIPEIGVQSPLISLGLNPDQTLEVPKDFAVVGWYRYRPVPGNPGPSVVAGHVDSRVGPAVFARLRELHAGSRIDVRRSDGTTAIFSVDALEQHDKDAFPTDRVYGPTAGAALRVITCGGSFDWSTRHYLDNVIVFATLREIAPA
jgi:sortase (surface protein transpeptidase)